MERREGHRYISHKERLVKPIDIARSEYGWVKPQDLVRKAISLLQPDGSLLMYDDVIKRPYLQKPEPNINPDELSDYHYQSHMLELAGWIALTVEQLGHDVSTQIMTSDINTLATFLQPYRHHLEFLEYTTALIQISEDHPVPPYPPYVYYDLYPVELGKKFRSDVLSLMNERESMDRMQ